MKTYPPRRKCSIELCAVERRLPRCGNGLRWGGGVGRMDMKVWNLFPWKALARRTARRHGFVDPITLFDRIREFAQPSEVGEPIELLRAGATFHARGLVNRAIQFNLDWVWPYWVERQFNPSDESFIPRAFSFSHINLTHRNWTAVGLLDFPHYSIVDPRGLVTPHFDGWSLDFWLIDSQGRPLLLPSRGGRCEQRMQLPSHVCIRTQIESEGCRILSTVVMEANKQAPECVIRVNGSGADGTRLAVVVRPYNPEGISFIDSIAVDREGALLRVNGSAEVRFGAVPARVALSCYTAGDVLRALHKDSEQVNMRCRAGMATAAAIFPVNTQIEVRIPISGVESPHPAQRGRSTLKSEASGYARLELPDQRWKQLYDTAVATVVLHCPGEVYPGPYTYKRFWYRDAAYILHALAGIGGKDRCRRALDLFPRGQLANGYFRSQEGEWDSNGEVLWIIERCLALAGEALPESWANMVEQGAQWILQKRMGPGSPHPGLLPAGFSAEHLGLNDFYYWDDFWGIAGLRAAAKLLRTARPSAAAEFDTAADEFQRTVEDSISRSNAHKEIGAIPAAPDRRMDSGAVGSIVCDYPLSLFPAGDPRVLRTAEWLMQNSFQGGGFFQNMIHSGINAYLTIHLAQVLLRAGDARGYELLDATAKLASPTGQWPEAIHPRTLGGCMGDGQHVWAAAEWVLAMRSLFIREEGQALVIGPGLKAEWIEAGAVSFGPAATSFGAVTIRAALSGAEISLDVMARWHGEEPELRIHVPGCEVRERNGNRFTLARTQKRELTARAT